MPVPPKWWPVAVIWCKTAMPWPWTITSGTMTTTRCWTWSRSSSSMSCRSRPLNFRTPSAITRSSASSCWPKRSRRGASWRSARTSPLRPVRGLPTWPARRRRGRRLVPRQGRMPAPSRGACPPLGTSGRVIPGPRPDRPRPQLPLPRGAAGVRRRPRPFWRLHSVREGPRLPGYPPVAHLGDAHGPRQSLPERRTSTIEMVIAPGPGVRGHRAGPGARASPGRRRVPRSACCRPSDHPGRDDAPARRLSKGCP